jgi:hypothetical protein
MDFPQLAETAFLRGNILFIPLTIHRNPFHFPLYTSSGKRLGFTTVLDKNRIENLVWMAEQIEGYTPTTHPTKKDLTRFLEGRVCFIRI